MIPLNRPGYPRSYNNKDFVGTHFPGYYSQITATAGDGLNLIYHQLKKKYGTMRVAVSPFACFQAIYPIVTQGHIPVFVDIDKYTLNIDTDKLINTLNIDAVELIHLGGNPNQMDIICQWANQHNIVIIEDCAQALGSRFKDKFLGSFGSYAVFSLIKNLHSPMGGLLLGRNEFTVDQFLEVSPLLYIYRQVKKYLESQSNHHTYNLWNLFYLLLLYLKEKGHKLTNNEAYCVGTVMDTKLRKLLWAIDDLNQKRLANASYIINMVDKTKYSIQKVPKGGVSNRNRLLFRLPNANADNIIALLRKAGIAANNLTQNYLNGFQVHVAKDKWLGAYYHKYNLECYDDIFNRIIAIPCSPYLKQSEMDYIIKILNQIK